MDVDEVVLVAKDKSAEPTSCFNMASGAKNLAIDSHEIDKPNGWCATCIADAKPDCKLFAFVCITKRAVKKTNHLYIVLQKWIL